jgi:dTDP-4-dehydrorhamnose reductase
MKRIVVTGSNGQLGNELKVASQLYPGVQFYFTDIAELDICDEKAVAAFFEVNSIDLVINCAAYTAVDRAEEEPELCYRINRDAVGILGAAANQYNAGMIHVSTDYVFNGEHHVPYNETDPVQPASVYGKSKLAGEEELLRVKPDAVIVRTSWLYSSFGANFVKTMLKLGSERDELKVVFDQVGSPTYAADLASALLTIAMKGAAIPGIYHYSNEGVCSWYDFTLSILAKAGLTCRVVPIESHEYPAKTPRPHYSVLNKAKIKSVYDITIPHWEDGLNRCLSALTPSNPPH